MEDSGTEWKTPEISEVCLDGMTVTNHRALAWVTLSLISRAGYDFLFLVFIFVQFLKITFHLQLLQNIGCSPSVVQ